MGIFMSKEKIIHPTMQRVYEATELDQSDLAHAINISPQAVNNWDLRGISKKGLTLISDMFNVSSDWILSGNGDVKIGRHNLSHDQLFKKNYAPTAKWVPVKSYSKMGDDGYYTDMGYVGDAGDGYVQSLTASSSAYAVRGSGDSMYPAIRSGWYIVCDPEASPIPTEFVEVELKDGRRTIKEFIGITNDVLHLLGVNGEKRISIEMSDVQSINAVIDIIPPSRHVYKYPDIQTEDRNYG